MSVFEFINGKVELNQPLHLDPELEKLVPPVTEAAITAFDFTRPFPPIDVYRRDGKLWILDGRLRYAACIRAHQNYAYRTHDFASSIRAKRFFKERHNL